MIALFATLQIRIYFVIIHEIKIQNINTTNQTQIINKLHKMNARLHSDLKIIKISRSAKIIKKIDSSFKLKITIVEMTNNLINEKLIKKLRIENLRTFV